MGNLAPSLLQALGVANSPSAAPSPLGGMPNEGGGMTEAVMGFPSVMRGGMSEGGALPTGGMGADAEAVVRGFKPKKISFWGALGDQLLKHWGNEPAFSKRIQSKNMRNAMEGFTHDPMQAVSRLAQIPGMEGKAWELMNQIQDNKRADAQFDRVYGNDQEKTLKNASGLAAIALANPGSRKAAVTRYNQILRRKGLEEFTLEDDVDDLTLAAIAGGAIPPDKREQLELRRERLEQTGRATDSQIEHRKVTEQQGERRLDQADQRIEIAIQKANAKRNAVGGKAYKDPNGVLVEWSPDGSQLKATSPDGRVDMYKMGLDGQKIKVKSMSKEEYAAAQAAAKAGKK